MSNFRGTAYSNKHVKKWHQQKNRNFHVTHLKNMRPVTSSIQQRQDSHWINNKKKQMIIQDRFTEIQKANRLLLEKITDIMGKRRSISTASHNHMTNNNKSLNSSFRKKQMQNIQIQNAKLLKRIQQKKSAYQTQKFKSDWKKQKKVMSNLANYPFIINDRKRFNVKKNPMHSLQTREINNKIQLCRMRVIDGTNFLVTVRLNQKKLQIIGDTRKKQQVKIIQIQRDQAIDFIDSQCNGRVQLLFQRLRFDKDQDVLYLVGRDIDIKHDVYPYQREKEISRQRKRNQNDVCNGKSQNIGLNQGYVIKQRDDETDRKRQINNDNEEKTQFHKQNQKQDFDSQRHHNKQYLNRKIQPEKKSSEWVAKQINKEDQELEQNNYQKQQQYEDDNKQKQKNEKDVELQEQFQQQDPNFVLKVQQNQQQKQKLQQKQQSQSQQNIHLKQQIEQYQQEQKQNQKNQEENQDHHYQ